MLGTDFNLPEGYKLAEGVDQITNIQVPFGSVAGHTMIVEKIAEDKSSIVKAQFVDSITNEVMGGGDYFVDADGDGIFNHSELEQWVPEGYKLAEFGDFQVSEYKDTALQLTVEKENKSSIVKVQFVDADTNEVMGGGDYFVDGDGDGIFTDREVVEYVPGGYELAEFGDFQVSEYTETPLQLSVVKTQKSSIVKVQFVDSITNEVMGGGDYFVDADGDGIFNHSELEEWVPEGYKLAEFGDFQVSEYKDTALQLTVEKENKSSIVKVQFVDADTNEVMGGGDYFVDGDGDGIFTHREVVECVPEGYKLAEFGDFQVSEYTETPLQLSVVKVEKSSIVKVQFVDADTDEVIAGGDYFVDEDGDGIFNHSELVEWVPEGYELAEFGDFQVSEYKETPLQLSVVKKAEEKPEIPWIDLEPSTPVKPEIPWTDLEPSTPVKPETPWTDLEPSTQVDSETPGKDDTNKDDGKTENTDKKTENKSKTPKTGDDLQAAGTFSILGAGALAAIAALLKKRK